MVILNEKSYKAITNSDGVMSTGNAFYVRFKLSDYVIHKQKRRREKKKAYKDKFSEIVFNGEIATQRLDYKP